MPSDIAFTKGEQPCQNFAPQQNQFGSNRHQCFCCQDNTTVSFCENCYYDHHENGIETCICRRSK